MNDFILAVQFTVVSSSMTRDWITTLSLTAIYIRTNIQHWINTKRDQDLMGLAAPRIM